MVATCLQDRDRQLFQYKNSTVFNTFLKELFGVYAGSALCPLYQIYNVDLAVGKWLVVIGQLLNVDKVFPGLQNAFTWDLSTWDGPDVWDGFRVAASDDIYRALIKAQIMKNNSTFTINEIYAVLIFVLGIDTIKIEETSIKHLTITINFFGAPDALRIFNALDAFDHKWFGVPQGVGVTIVREIDDESESESTS